MGIFSLLGFLAVLKLLRKHRLEAERGSSCRGPGFGFIFRRVSEPSGFEPALHPCELPKSWVTAARADSRRLGAQGNISVGSGGSSVVRMVHFLLVLVVLGNLMESKSHSGVYRAWLEGSCSHSHLGELVLHLNIYEMRDFKTRGLMADITSLLLPRVLL